MALDAKTLDFDDRLEIFFGRASEALAYVYARYSGTLPPGCQLSGQLVGPHCQYAHTLPAQMPFIDQGPGQTALSRAVVPEPSFWTPELPHLYRATLELRHEGRVLVRAQRPFGIRPLGVAGTKFIYGGRRWVMRGVRAEAPEADQLASWHDADAALVVRNPADSLCAAASQQGVLIVAVLAADELSELGRLGRWPAVAVAALPLDAELAANLVPSNLVLAARVGPRDTVPAWAQVSLWDTASLPEVPAWANQRATIVTRASDVRQTAATGRATCDRLQADAAALGDWAGYIV